MRWLLLLGLACGGTAPPTAQPNAGHAEAQTPGSQSEPAQSEPEPSEPARPEPPEPAAPAALSTETETLVLACGRADIELPVDWRVAFRDPCTDPGYPMPIDGRGFAGASTEVTVERGECELDIVTSELHPVVVPQLRAPSTPRTESTETPEGSRFTYGITASAACAADADQLFEATSTTLRIHPVRGDSPRAISVPLSSAGHALTGTLPAGFWIYSVGGMADAYETHVELRSGGEAFAALLTSWDMAAQGEEGPGEFEPRRFQPRLLRRAPSWRDASDPLTAEWLEQPVACRETRAWGPEPRIRTTVLLCGPSEGHSELLEVLRSLRFSPPSPEP